MHLHEETNAVTIKFEGQSYTIFYTSHSSGEESRHFNVSIKDEALKQISGATLEYTVTYRDNLEELDYPPIQNEKDLLLKKSIIREIFKKEGINYTV